MTKKADHVHVWLKGWIFIDMTDGTPDRYDWVLNFNYKVCHCGTVLL